MPGVPPVNWIKVNCDGASKQNGEIAGCGGLCRGPDGKWMRGFSYNLGMCNAFVAELWGAYYSLKMAWEMDCTQVILKSDPKTLVDFLLGDNQTFTRHKNLVDKIRSFM